MKPLYQLHASGLVKSTTAILDCHSSLIVSYISLRQRQKTYHCQTFPFMRFKKYPFLTPSLNMDARCEM